MKARISKSEIEHIKNCLQKHDNVSIYMGQLSLSAQEKLQKHFKVNKEYFGY